MHKASAAQKARESKSGAVDVNFTIDTSKAKVRWWEKVEEPQTIWRALVSNDGLDYYVNTETGETTWEKPEELMTEEELNSSGDWVWVPHPTQCYVPARVIETSSRKYLVEKEDGKKKKVDKGSAIKLLRSSLKRIVADLTLLDDMTAPLILHCLRKRFEDNKIYTNVGTILISVNPYQRLPLYTDAVIKRYINRGLGVVDMPPHVYNIAHDSFYGVTSFGKNQSVVISGESGAGKTEATKTCLQYLARIAGSVSGVEKKVLQANPILEAFGNAKTIRNDNSSRFGKYLEVFFDAKGRITDSATENYLLEKIRVVNPAPRERNFHIFYQITKAAPSALRTKLKLGKPTDYTYLRACVDVDTIDDDKEFKEVMQAFGDLGIAKSESEGMFAVCAGILALGNVTFQNDGKATSVKDKSWLSTAADVLQIDAKSLEKTLVSRTLRIRGQSNTQVNMDATQSSDTRHALCKFMYGKMFDWLVKRINKSMGKGNAGLKKQLKYIGILDIFGFEIFKHNSFEQLCINFTNEMLQQHFNRHTFKLEEAMYVSEGIQFDHIEFIDNQPMLDLIRKKPIGILPLLDEELVVPRGSDKTFLAKMIQKQSKNPVFKRQMKKPMNFIVKHYAGQVSYDANGFLEKNRDTLTEDLVEMLQTSKLGMLNVLYPPDMQMSAKARKSSLSRQFQGQLDRLMRNLNATEPHYIRCIKPNNDKAPMSFVPQNCYEQLLYSGVFEAVAIRKQGFPFRLSHKEFNKRYAICCKTEPSSSSDRAACKDIIVMMKLDTKNTQIGKTRVLYRAEEHKKLELERSIRVKNQEITEALRRLTRVDANSMPADERENYFVELAEAVSEADKFRVKTPDAERARKMLEAFVEARMDPQTKRELKEALESQDRKKLEAVMAKCEREGYRTSLTRKCAELLSQIEDAEAALEVALTSMKEDFLEKAIEMCDEFNYQAPNAKKARKMLKNIRKAKAGIKRAMAKMKRKWLNQAIAFCDGFGYDSKLVQDCRIITKKVNICHKMLTKAKAAVDQAKLQKAVRACDKIKYRSPLEHECRGLLFRVRRINEEVKNGYKKCIEDQVRTVVAAADEIKMPGKELDAWRKLIKGKYDKFLAEQYRCAVKCKDHARAVRVMVKRKDIVVQKKEGKLGLSAYDKLKDPMIWARERWFGGEKHAKVMLEFQWESIHAPLTTTASADIADARRRKDVKRRCQAAFETIQKWMGQRNTSRMPQRISELLMDALQNEEVRTETYIAFMKQCTNNPVNLNPGAQRPEKVEAVARVWELLSLCLSAFPPTEGFEDYLEAWLRLPAVREHADKFHCRSLLRQIVYNGADQKAMEISQEELKDVAAVLKSRLNAEAFREPNYKKKKAKWFDLKKSFVKKGSSLKISKPPKSPYASAPSS